MQSRIKKSRIRLKTKKHMSTQKRKFELFARLQALGFTYEESEQLRRIEITLSRWAEAECNGDIQREELRGPAGEYVGEGKPYRVYEQGSRAKRYPVADRESGALRRLKAIVDIRNTREVEGRATEPRSVVPYYQGDCRGCMLYLLTREQLTQDGKLLPVESYYTRGLAVCA